MTLNEAMREVASINSCSRMILSDRTGTDRLYKKAKLTTNSIEPDMLLTNRTPASYPRTDNFQKSNCRRTLENKPDRSLKTKSDYVVIDVDTDDSRINIRMEIHTTRVCETPLTLRAAAGRKRSPTSHLQRYIRRRYPGLRKRRLNIEY